MQQANQSPLGEINTHVKQFVSNQRLVFGVIAFLGLASFVLTYMSFSSRIGGTTGTLAQSESPQAQIDQFNQLLATPFGTVAGDTTDTDKDGIADAQELSFYRTSPYIADTDGDGFLDGDEVKDGKDPTCAEGKTCRQAPLAVPQPEETEDLEKLGQIAADLGKQLEGEQLENTGEEDSLSGQDLSNLSVQEIRDLLLQSGKISAEQLSKIDDETILRVYGEVIKK